MLFVTRLNKSYQGGGVVATPKNLKNKHLRCLFGTTVYSNGSPVSITRKYKHPVYDVTMMS